MHLSNFTCRRTVRSFASPLMIIPFIEIETVKDPSLRCTLHLKLSTRYYTMMDQTQSELYSLVCEGAIVVQV